MAVLESKPHALTVRSSLAPYGCSNCMMQDGYWAPARIAYPDGSFVIGSEFIEHTMSTECRYDKSLTDLRCQFCDHRGTGEKYDEMIRQKGS